MHGRGGEGAAENTLVFFFPNLCPFDYDFWSLVTLPPSKPRSQSMQRLPLGYPEVRETGAELRGRAAAGTGPKDWKLKQYVDWEDRKFWKDIFSSENLLKIILK